MNTYSNKKLKFRIIKMKDTIKRTPIKIGAIKTTTRGTIHQIMKSQNLLNIIITPTIIRNQTIPISIESNQALEARWNRVHKATNSQGTQTENHSKLMIGPKINPRKIIKIIETHILPTISTLSMRAHRRRQNPTHLGLQSHMKPSLSPTVQKKMLRHTIEDTQTTTIIENMMEVPSRIIDRIWLLIPRDTQISLTE